MVARCGVTVSGRHIVTWGGYNLWAIQRLVLSMLIKNVTANMKDRSEVEQLSRGLKEAVNDFDSRGSKLVKSSGRE